MKKELVAVILAGGRGNRFWPLSTDKSLFPFFGKPLLVHSALTHLPKSVSRAVIITNDLNHSVLSKIKYPVPVTTVIQPSASGMANAILSAESELRNCALFIMNADDISDRPYFEQVIALGQQPGIFGAVAGVKTTHYVPGGYLATDGKLITGIVEKPGEGHEPSPYLAMLGHYIADSNTCIDELKHTKSETDDVYEKALSTLMKRNVFKLYPFEGKFTSLKYPWHTLNLMQVLLEQLPSHRGKNVEIKSNVVIEGKVYLEDDVRIFENSKIIGPAYVGRGTVIGNNNIIRNSHVGAHCVTGFNTDITRSYIGDNCWFHTNYVGDSVLEENVSMGSGAVLANLRLDDGIIHSKVNDQRISSYMNKLGVLIGKHVRIGVNTSIMPGVKIGKESLIGSGIVIDRDIPDNSFCSVKSVYSISRNQKSVSEVDRSEFRKKL